MTAEGTRAVGAIKGILDTDSALRNRFLVCSRTRRGTSEEEVSNWREVLHSSKVEKFERDEIRAALSRLTVLLLPTSNEAQAITSAGESGDVMIGTPIMASGPEEARAAGVIDPRDFTTEQHRPIMDRAMCPLLLAPVLDQLPSLDGYVHDRLYEDERLRRAFDRACDETNSRTMAQVAYALYREVILDDSAAARRDREHIAKMSEIEKRLFPDTEVGQHIDEILAALDRTAAREMPESVRGVHVRVRDMHAASGPRPKWRTREHIVAALASDTVLLEALIESSRSANHDVLVDVSRRLSAPCRASGAGEDGRNFSDHVFALRYELLPSTPGAADGGWLSGLDRKVTGVLESAGLLDALSYEEFAAYVERARDHVLAGDRPAARLEYEALYRAARKASKKST